MKKKTLKCVCHECDVGFDIVITSNDTNKKLVAEICPFCGDVCDLRDDSHFNKFYPDVDDEDGFNYEKYYDRDDEDFDEEDE